MNPLPNCVCGKNKYKLVVKKNIGKNDYSIYRCVNCDLERTIPIPRKTTSLTIDNNYRLENLKLWEYFAGRTLDLIEKYIQISDVKALDLGCNVGILVKLAKERGFDMIGIDIDKKAIRLGKDKFSIDLKPLSLEEAHFKKDSFNCVVMNHTLEHILNLRKNLNDIKYVLSNNGILIIEVPNSDSLPAKIQNLRNKRWYGYDFAHHVWHFTKKSVRNLLEKEGFNVLEINTSVPMYYEKRGKISTLFRNLILKLSSRLESADQIIVVAKIIK